MHSVLKPTPAGGREEAPRFVVGCRPAKLHWRICVAIPLVAALPCVTNARVAAVAVAPSSMASVGKISDRYQSYNIEMLEVTGGKFWRPYGPQLEAALKKPAPSNQSPGDTPAGMNPEVYEYRPPIDLANRRLRTLAAALGPSYMRVSGTWANTPY